MLETIRQRVEELLWNPKLEAGPLRFVSRVGRFLYALARDAWRGELTLRAMSLVFTTLLAIVPLIAFSFSVLKAFGFHKQVEPLLYTFLQPLGEQGAGLTKQVISFVDNTHGVALGTLGLALLIYTVFSMVKKIEEAFNFVWQVQRNRSIGRRFSEYLSVILIAPVLMATALGMKGTVANTAFAKWLLDIPAFSNTAILLGQFMPYVLVVMAFTFIYGFIPNTSVSLRASLVGGVTGGLTWSVIGAAFAAFVSASTRYQAIYSSFAIPLLALVWLYISWLIVLLGARISYYYQHPEYLKRGRRRIELTNRLRERLALTVMYFVGEEFRRKSTHWTTNKLAGHLGVTAEDLEKIVTPLEHRKLLAITESQVLLPGRDTELIELRDILDAIRHDVSEAYVLKTSAVQHVDAIMDDIEQAAATHLGGRSLRDLVEQHTEATS